MPNRMLRDWTQSEKVDKLNADCERFFVRLIMKVDDFGCFYADPRLLKANLYPLKLDSIREADISRWMAECQKAGLIALYEEADKKRYVFIKDFNQRLRAKKSKFPMPSDDRHVSDKCRPELEEEVEVEKEVEEEEKAHNASLGVVVYNAESEILKNQIRFEEICMKTNTDFAAAKIVLRKYHLYLEEKEQYPKGKNAVFAGFEKWLTNEKKFYGTHQQTFNGSKPGTAIEQNEAADKW